MITTNLKNVLEDNIPSEYSYGVYVWIDHNNQILYVGQSTNMSERFIGHIGRDWRRNPSTVGASAMANMPLAMQWSIRLYNIDDCREYYPPEMLALAIFHPPMDSIIMDMAEIALIAELGPRYNTFHNNGPRRNTEFNTTGYAHSDVSSADYLDF